MSTGIYNMSSEVCVQGAYDSGVYVLGVSIYGQGVGGSCPLVPSVKLDGSG